MHWTGDMSQLKLSPTLLLPGDTHDFSYQADNMQSSSCSIIAHPLIPSTYLLNQRMVNYFLDEEGQCVTPPCGFVTRNRCLELSHDFQQLSATSVEDDHAGHNIEGVEDIRLFRHKKRTLYAAVGQHANGQIGVLTGEYGAKLEPVEMRTECTEKNWVFVPYKEQLCMVYSWHPLRLIKNSKFNVVAEIPTPEYLKGARGSTNACVFGDEVWFVVHIVDEGRPRHYYHVFVIMDRSLRVLRCSVPFKFEDVPVQFCLGLVVEQDRVITSYSTNDSSSKVRVTPKADVEQLFDAWRARETASSLSSVSKSSSCSVIVSAYFPLPNFEHRSQEEYLRLGKILVDVPTTKIIFAPQSVIDSLPKNAHTEYVCVELSEIDAMWPSFDLPKNRNLGKDTALFIKVMLAKTYFLTCAAKKLGMDRRYIWMDIALPRFYYDFAATALTTVESVFDAIRIPFQWPVDQYREDNDNVQWFTLGMLVAGTGSDLCWFHEQTRADLMRRKRLVWEVNVWAALMHAHPERFSLYKANHDSSMLQNFNNSERYVFMFWTGNNTMCGIRQRCVELFEEVSECKVRLITPSNLGQYILPEYPLHPAYKYLSLTHKSDYLRTYFMHHYGGAYSDVKRTTGSWLPAFDALYATESAWAIGYQEVSDGVWEKDEKLKRQACHLIGTGSFIFKPRTPFTHRWFSRMNALLDEKLEQLKKNPAQHPRDKGEEGPYPIDWTEMLARIFHPICFEFRDCLLRTLPKPEMYYTDYTRSFAYDYRRSFSLYNTARTFLDAASKCCVRVIMGGDADCFQDMLSNLKLYPPILPGETRASECDLAPNTDSTDVTVTYNGEVCVINSWHPLKVIRGSKDNVVAEIDTPPYLRHARGSTNACVFGNELWFVVHLVDNGEPQHYYHLFVVTDHFLNVLRCSRPFKFEDVPVQFCLGLAVGPERVLTSYSTHDGTSKVRASVKSDVDRMFVGDTIIVTAYFPLHHHLGEEGKSCLRRLAQVPAEKVIFSTQEIIDTLPPSPDTHYQAMELSTVIDVIPDFDSSSSKDSEVLRFANAKTALIECAAKIKGLERSFMWIDCALPQSSDFESACLRAVTVQSEYSGLIRAPRLQGTKLSEYIEDNDNVQQYTLGTVLAGTWDDLSWFHYEVLKELHRRKRLVWEVNVWAAVMHAHPERFSLYDADLDGSSLTNF